MAMCIRETTLGSLKCLPILEKGFHLGLQLDDSNAFCLASKEGVDKLLEVFNMHYLASSAMINIKKTHTI